MDSEEAFATLHHAVPPDSGYRMRLLCAHGTCKRLESQTLTSLRSLWEGEVTREEAFPLLTAPPGSHEGRSSCLGSFPWQCEQVAVSFSVWDLDSSRAVLPKVGF